MPSDNYDNNTNQQLNSRVSKRLTAKAESLSNSLESIVPNISYVAEKIVAALLNENKLLICGSGSSHILSQYMASQLINRFETDRPALPVIALTSDTSVFSTMDTDSNFEDVYTRQIQALGHSNDLLVSFIANELTDNMLDAIQTAHEQKLHVILICSDTNEGITNILEENDKIIQLPHINQSDILELQLLTLHSICDLIDHLLFGTP